MNLDLSYLDCLNNIYELERKYSNCSDDQLINEISLMSGEEDFEDEITLYLLEYNVTRRLSKDYRKNIISMLILSKCYLALCPDRKEDVAFFM